MKNKDEKAFLQSIRGTTPIKKNNKLIKPIHKNKNELLSTKNTRINLNTPKTNNISKNINSSLFKIQKTTINKKLKKGKIPINKKIDFHGLSVIDAETLFLETIKNCYKKNLRCILFITGKGVLKKDKKETLETKLYYGKIRNNFFSWTKKSELQQYILSVEQASIEYGADGAFFVYLRKQRS